MKKIFEVDPVRCEKCGGGMKLVAVILDDRELDRILAHQGWPTEFPKTRRYEDFRSGVCAGPEGSRPQASRAPPGSVERGDESSQADPRGDWEVRRGLREIEPLRRGGGLLSVGGTRVTMAGCEGFQAECALEIPIS